MNVLYKGVMMNVNCILGVRLQLQGNNSFILTQPSDMFVYLVVTKLNIRRKLVKAQPPQREFTATARL